MNLWDYDAREVRCEGTGVASLFGSTRLSGGVITNIADWGAHISIADSDALPDSFVVLLAENGATRRRCRVIWRKPRETGIKFDSWLDERIRAGGTPAAIKENKEAEKV